MAYLLIGLGIGLLGTCVWYTCCAIFGQRMIKSQCIRMFIFFSALATFSSFGAFLYDTHDDNGYTLTMHTYPIQSLRGYYTTVVGNTTYILSKDKLFGQNRELDIPSSKIQFKYTKNNASATVFVKEPNTFSTFEKVMSQRHKRFCNI